MDNNLPLDFLHWGLALLPLILLLVMLVGLKWSGGTSGWIAMAVATLIAFFLYEAPVDNVAIGFGMGLWEAFFILLVVWAALLLYHITDESGSFKVIREEIQKHSENQLFLVLAFGWIFASFLQGVAGFGVPIAVVAPLLVGIGVKPIAAIVIPLIGHTWANMFGTLGVGWIATINAIQIEEQTLTLVYTAILLWIINLLGGLAICWVFAKWKGVKEGFLIVAVISLVHGGGQLAIVTLNAELSAFIPSILAFAALFLLSRRKQYKEKSETEEKTDVLEEPDDDEEEEEKPKISLHKALMPYYFLSVVSIIFLGIPPIADFLDQFEYGFSFPEAETGYGFQIDAEDPYSPLAPFTHPAFYLFLSAIFGYIWYKYLGLNKKDTMKNVFEGLKGNAVGASVAISGFLTMTMIMEASGQTNVLALGIAEVSPPVVYAGLANILGIVGAFMTSSNTSSNVLFSPLHASVVESMEELSLAVIIAAQSAGGALGNVISPANVILGTSTAGIQGRESEVYKITLVFALIAGVAISAVSILLHFIG